MRGLIMCLVGLATAAPVVAAERTGYMAIAAGDLRKAEATLQVERRANPDRPEVMLNLAAVYQLTGRPAAASDLYAAVLQAAPVPMDMPSGAVVSSHVVAQRGLAKLHPALVAAR